MNNCEYKGTSYYLEASLKKFNVQFTETKLYLEFIYKKITFLKQ